MVSGGFSVLFEVFFVAQLVEGLLAAVIDGLLMYGIKISNTNVYWKSASFCIGYTASC